jgi:hypothetical protein
MKTELEGFTTLEFPCADCGSKRDLMAFAHIEICKSVPVKAYTYLCKSCVGKRNIPIPEELNKLFEKGEVKK